jgi:hypothetical protein
MQRSLHPFDEARARAVGWMTAWDSQDAHRTATTGDEAGALRRGIPRSRIPLHGDVDR